jgi:hypothetical protein
MGITTLWENCTVLPSWVIGFLEFYEYMLYCLIALPVSDKCKRSDQELTCYVETQTDDYQQFQLCVDKLESRVWEKILYEVNKNDNPQ